MADKKEETTEATADKKSKRQLRPSAPSIREQSEKAAAKANQPKERSLVSKILLAPFRILAWPFRFVYRKLLKPLGSFLGRYKFFRIIGNILFPPYFRSAWSELRLVTWPNFRQTRDLSIAVLIFSIVFGIIVAIVDYGLDKVFRKVILNQ